MNNAALDKACVAFNREKTFAGGIAAAIEAYNREAETFVGEAVASEPQRDYRKELWIATSQMHVGTSSKKIDFSNRVVEGFDQFFKEKQ